MEGAGVKREGAMIRKVPFLIGNRHFLIRKGHFTNYIMAYVAPSRSPPSIPLRSFPMIRRNLLVAVAVIVSVVLSACADVTGPTEVVCPVSSGGSVCAQ